MTHKQFLFYLATSILTSVVGIMLGHRSGESERARLERQATFYKQDVESWKKIADGWRVMKDKAELEEDICSKNLKAEKVLYQGLARDFLLQEGRLKEIEIAGRPRTCNMQQKLDCRLEWELLGDMHYNKCKNALETCQMSQNRGGP